MADSAGERQGDEEGLRFASVWDAEDDEARVEVAGGRGEAGVERRAVAPGGRPAPSGTVPFPFERLEAAARALAGLDQRLAESAVRRRWLAAMRRRVAADQGRLCGFPVDVADACLVQWDPLVPGQSRHNGMWVVARGLRASGLVQRRTRARLPEREQLEEIGRTALGRWCAESERGALEACGRWQELAEAEARGLLVFCKALAVIGSWQGLDVEERAVLMGMFSPWLARVFVPTRWCCGSLMREVSWGPAGWEREARAGGDEWIARCLEAVAVCAEGGHNVLRQLELRHGLALRASPARRRSHSYERAIDHLFECPVVDVQSLMEALGMSRAGAQRLIDELVRVGVLNASTRGRSRRYYAWQIAADGFK